MEQNTQTDTQANNMYTCACCKQIFEKGLTDEEALAELGETFPDVPADECALVCDDCYNKFFK